MLHPQSDDDFRLLESRRDEPVIWPSAAGGRYAARGGKDTARITVAVWLVSAGPSRRH